MTRAADWPLADGESLMREWMDGVGGKKLHHEKDHYLVKLIPGCRQVLIFGFCFLGVFDS